MKIRFRIDIILLLFFVQVFVQANTTFAASKQYIYTDRNYCISGDTVWFKVWVPDTLEKNSNVVHVQIASIKGAVVSTVTQISKQQWAEGFVHVPDSLSSGVYLVLAFFNEQRKIPDLAIDAKTLFVYNRFEEQIKELEVPVSEAFTSGENISDILDIQTDKKIYSTREIVEGTIRLKSDEILHATISAKVVDPLADDLGGTLNLKVSDTKTVIPDFAEKDGVLISGKVLDDANNPQKDVLTLLSISSEPPYFDYCITNENGGFNFYLPNAFGNAELIYQAIDKNGKELQIISEMNSLQTEEFGSRLKILSPQQSEFVNTVVQANFINKLFNRSKLASNDSLRMPERYSTPFYGKPTKSVTPSEFFDLPSFTEISRELLLGVQYRTQNNEATLRILNADRGKYFGNEPLRLLNGIPVFSNSFFSNLISTDINYVDIVEQERVFGDLIFNGVFAVSLYDKSNSWIAMQPNILQINYPCLQEYRKNSYQNKIIPKQLEPDTRQNYLWEILPISDDSNFKLQLSDMKGDVQIVVEGVTVDGRVFKTSKIIEVQ